MNRYLLNLSYIGTKFRGIQKTVRKDDKEYLDTTTVQGCIEIALQHFRPINPIQVHLSSRTDAGVHALHSSVHVDLQRKDNTLYPTTAITTTLNKTFDKKNLPIRIISTVHVPETFHCRYNAKARTYLYRLAVSKIGPKESEKIRYQNLFAFIPIEDIEKCFYIQNGNFDINKVIAASKLFLGRHDFRTFMGTSRQKHFQDKPMFTIRNISSIDIKPGNPPINSYEYQQANSIYNYWDIKITGKSFLYKQVRRIVGSLIALGSGYITEQDIYEMLTIPSKHTWHHRVLVVPAYGLYLCKVHYNEEDFEIQQKRNKLKCTETIITRCDGKIFIESKAGLKEINENSYGFVVDTKPDYIPACILDYGLYLGSQDSVTIENLQKYNINHILSVGIEISNIDITSALINKMLNVKFISCLDLPETKLDNILAITNKYIKTVLQEGGKVLVHCNAGVSRSTAIVIGYLILEMDMSFEEAIQLVKSKRECIQPNVGFIRQLKQLSK